MRGLNKIVLYYVIENLLYMMFVIYKQKHYRVKRVFRLCTISRCIRHIHPLTLRIPVNANDISYYYTYVFLSNAFLMLHMMFYGKIRINVIIYLQLHLSTNNEQPI